MKVVFRILCHFDNLSKKDNTALNRLTSVNGSGAAAKSYSSFDYDTRGNITNNSHVEMSYNLANQMTAALGKSYSYDGHNRRVKVAGDGDTRYYFYSQSGQLLLSEDNGVQTNYIYLGNRLIAEDRQATTTFIHTDRLGSPVARTNSTGRVESRRHYQPFGDTYEAPNDDIGYTGHKYDNDLGLSYMQARYYDPVIGRFYSNDPVGFTGEVDTFNRYAYAANNPYKYVDPNGEAKLNINIGAQFAWGGGVRVGLGISIDFTYGEISVSGTGGVRGGATAGIKAGITVSDSKKLGNSASLKGSVNADVGLVAAQGKIDLVAGQVSTDTTGVQNTSNGGELTPLVGFKDGNGGTGLVVNAKAGVSAGADVTGTATLSIPESASVIATGVQNFANEFKEVVDKCMSSGC